MWHTHVIDPFEWGLNKGPAAGVVGANRTRPGWVQKQREASLCAQRMDRGQQALEHAVPAETLASGLLYGPAPAVGGVLAGRDGTGWGRRRGGRRRGAHAPAWGGAQVSARGPPPPS